MVSKNLVICDSEEGYAQALAMHFMRKKELAAEVQVCSTVTQVMELEKTKKIHLLFLAGEYAKEAKGKLQAEKIFLLTTGTEEADGENQVYKYQSGEKIVEDMIRICGLEASENESIYKGGRKQGGKIIGIFSPVHRIGKTTYGLKLGEEMAATENVLYLNLEIYGGIGGHFEAGEQTLADVLYYARQEKGNLGLLLTTVVKHRKNLDYIVPMPVAEDVKSVKAEEWLMLIRRILEQSIYDVIILDLDEGISGVYELLRACTKIYLLYTQDLYGQAKLRQFENEVNLLGYEDILRKLVRKERHDRGRTATRKDS